MSLRARLAAFWREIEPGFTACWDPNVIERWDARGEGGGWSIAFEGFGITFLFFGGRTPRRDERAQ